MECNCTHHLAYERSLLKVIDGLAKKIEPNDTLHVQSFDEFVAGIKQRERMRQLYGEPFGPDRHIPWVKS